MNLIYGLFYSVSITAVSFVSTTIRENKLYAISKNDSDSSFQVTAYELKDGLIKDIFSNGNSHSLTKLGRGFELKFFDIPDTLQEYRNKLWLKADQIEYEPEIDNAKSNFMGYINLSDMTFYPDSNFVKFPTKENFPLFGYTMNTISNEQGSFLYTTGGVIYSKSKNAYISSNSIFKYNFNTREWKDLSSDVKGKLKPVYSHSNVVMDSRYLLLIGGKVAKDQTKDSTLSIKENDLFKVNSIYNLTKFDTVTNNLESITVKSSMFDSSVPSLQLTDFSANFYNRKVYALGGMAISNEKQTPERNSKIGTLGFNDNQWSWSPINDEAGNIYNSPVEAKSSMLFNDQIILTSGKGIEKDSDGFQVFNLITQKMQSTLKFTKSDNNSNQTNGQSGLPGYAIALIAVGSTVLLLIFVFFAYIRYKRNKESSLNYDNESNESMEAIFSNPEDPSMEYILLGTKKDGIYFNTDIWYSGWIWENPMHEKANITQVFMPPSPESTGTSTTLHTNSSNTQSKKLQDSTLIEFNT
ncbi:hypothetical protein CONCODRAFT_19696 [Conidiobolus coronatus NRRL 28638]|uniref:Galactose oxidase n=1 Tax=Conidiobolus coronatus (strain ATCC 28846 / CBS 209.66 / NRRL 28638) TaxID=796925 RepID=A0A137NWW8_CONC2|nr:hypothetical protein CONCODRAFT_19696 [Conidiobolus coronatus NRRL 28638]|eukprot:KXN67330.1 hypothetical protein CONCODRAFT_19696 [Conidiobolus coronatus NRRL 28638]